MSRKSSMVTALATIGRAAKQNLQLTPKSKSRKDGGRGRRHRRSRGDSVSSSASSFDESYYSDISESDISSSYSEESNKDFSRSRKVRGRRRHRSRADKGRSNNERDRRRNRRRDRDRYSPDSYGEYTPQRVFKSPGDLEDDASQMIDLLMRILPFYGKGDGNSDAVVIDTIHRLPTHALEMQDVDGNTLLMVACQAGAFNLMPILLSKGCNANAKNNAGASSLHFACFVDTFSPDAAMALIRHGAVAEVSEHEFGCTPLHWAAFSGHLELCACLCRAGGKPSTKDKNGCDPIHYSKQNGHTACAQLLGSFLANRMDTATSLKAVGTPPPSDPADKPEWVRCLDSSTGSSFYHNKETGESLWGDDYRKVDQSSESIDDGIKPPENARKNAEVEKDAAVQRSIQGVINCETDHGDNSPEIEPAALNEPTKVFDDAKLTAIKEDLDETSTDEKVGPKLAEDICETSSIEDVELTPIAESESEKNDCPQVDPEREAALDHLDSWDAEEESQSSSQTLANRNEISDAPHKGPMPDDSLFNTRQKNLISTRLDLNSNSVEDRISSLHQKMESQLMHRLQHLEDKIAKQNLETSMKVEDGSSKLKENVAEMASTILQLRTESGTKDLEILSLKQQIVKLETKKISELKQSMNASVGDGDVHEESLKLDNEELLVAKAHHEQELLKAQNKIAQLNEQLDVANSRHEQAQQHLEVAERLARDEKQSRTTLNNMLEQAQQGEIGSISLQEEKYQAEETIAQLKEEIRNIQGKLESLNVNFVEEQLRATALEKELKETVTTHKSSMVELNELHNEKLEQMKDELLNVNSELGCVKEELTSAKMGRMEMMVAKDEAVDAMENALETARTAESKLQEINELVRKTEDLKKKNERLHLILQDETEKRKVLHNTLEDLKGRIRVYVRVRPLSKSEVKASYVNVITKEDERTCVMAGDAATASEVRDWEFDKIFYGSDVDGNTQENVFKDTSLLLTSAIDGFNVCIFAYGQTGSGKTYTMLGLGDGDNRLHQGLAPRVSHELFRKLAERESSYHIEVTASMLELYTDKLRDLLATSKNQSGCVGDLKIRLAEHTSSGLVEVDGAKVEHVQNAEELLGVFDRGTKGRASSSTKMNADSSRSHMIATIVLSLRNRRTGKIVNGKLTLVDLAGSERVSKSGATGHQLKEAQSINKSLSALGDVIGALTSGGRQHIPYRNHPLTMLMSDSIGGNAKTLMFVCCSPADYNRKETANSLDFAKRCRNVTNNAVASSGSNGSAASQVRALRAELSKIKEREKGAAKRRPVGMRRPGFS